MPLDTPGITPHARRDSLGVRGLGCMDLEFEDVRVPASARIGEAGRGFRLAMRALEGGRVAIAAQALGVGRRRSTRRSPTRAAARRSASRSAASRRFSFSSRIWRPTWRPRAC